MKALFIMSVGLDAVPMAQGLCLVMKHKNHLFLVKPACTHHSSGDNG